MSGPLTIVILAAGAGTRIGVDTPKCLIAIDGETILRRQIRLLSERMPDARFLIVIGYLGDEVTRHVGAEAGYVDNPEYGSTNTADSLRRAFDAAESGPILWLNGDVVFDEATADRVAESPRDVSWVAVQRRPVGEEEVKFTGETRITNIGKTIANGEGEAIGINLVSATDRAHLDQALEATPPTSYFEAALQLAIERWDVHFGIVDISDCDALEIDFPEDLEQARALFGQDSVG